MAIVSHTCNTCNHLKLKRSRPPRSADLTNSRTRSLSSIARLKREKHCHLSFAALSMTRLKRQASQELLPTRRPKLARRDPSVLSRLGGGVTTAAKFLSTNLHAFYEGTRLVRLIVTCVIRFSRSCYRGRDAQTVSPSKTIPPNVAYVSQTDASTYPKRFQGRNTTFCCNIASAFPNTFTDSPA